MGGRSAQNRAVTKRVVRCKREKHGALKSLDPFTPARFEEEGLEGGYLEANESSSSREGGDLPNPRQREDGSSHDDVEGVEQVLLLATQLTAEKLRDLTGFEDLQLVLSAEIRVDAAQCPVALIGDSMPALQQLRLSGSRIPCLRDLGTKLVRLQVLWLNNSRVNDCNGLQFCHQLRELYLSFNSISALGPLSGLLNLEVLDLEANQLSSFDEICSLSALAQLRSLTLQGNPLSLERKYRECVLRCLTENVALELLDDSPVAVLDAEPTAQLAAGGLLVSQEATELELLQESIKQNSDVGMGKMVQEEMRLLYSRQSTSASGARRRHSPSDDNCAGRPHVSSAPTLGQDLRLADTPKKGSRLVHSSEGSSPVKKGSAVQSVASALTAGGSGVFSGNLTRNLRARRQANLTTAVHVPKARAPLAATPPSEGTESDADGEMLQSCRLQPESKQPVPTESLFEKYKRELLEERARKGLPRPEAPLTPVTMLTEVHRCKEQEARQLENDLLRAATEDTGTTAVYESLDLRNDFGEVDEIL